MDSDKVIVEMTVEAHAELLKFCTERGAAWDWVANPLRAARPVQPSALERLEEWEGNHQKRWSEIHSMPRSSAREKYKVLIHETWLGITRYWKGEGPTRDFAIDAALKAAKGVASE